MGRFGPKLHSFRALPLAFLDIFAGVSLPMSDRIPKARFYELQPALRQSLLAIGAPSGVTDGIANDADGAASLSAFPFLLPPL